MNAREILDHLRAKSIAIKIDADELVIKAPQGAVNAELVAEIKKSKYELVALITAEEKPSPAADIKGCTGVRITPEMLSLVTLTQEEIDRVIGSVPHGASNIKDIYPLAPFQEGILFHHLLEETGDTYLLRNLLSFDTRQRLDAFLTALQSVINRHDILRSAARWNGLSQPLQIVHFDAKLPIRELEVPVGHDAAQELADRTDPRHLRLDIQRAPLLAAYLALDSDSGEWLLSLLIHHFISDHITLELIVGEVQTVLQGQIESLQPALPYRDFIAHIGSTLRADHEAYFREQLGNVEAPSAPFSVLNVQADGGPIQEARIVLDRALSSRIRECARREGVTPSIVFHVAWAYAMGQCSGLDDVVFGTVLSGRLQGLEGADKAIGVFINTLPVRVSMGSRGVRQVVSDTLQRFSDLLTHEQASLALALRCSAVPQPLPLFSTLLNYRHARTGSMWLGGDVIVASQGIRVLRSDERSNYPITVSVDDYGEEFALTAQCVQAVDSTRIVNYLHTTVDRLAEALVKNPNQPIRELSILPRSERDLLLYKFNETQVAYASDATIHGLFEEQVRERPDAIALVFGDCELTYAELNVYSNRVAHHLISLGLRPDDRVAICIERSLEMVVGLLGVLKAGGAYVPLDPSYPTERLAYMLKDSKPVVLLTKEKLRDGLSRTEIALLEVTLSDHDSILGRQPSHNPGDGSLGLTSRNLAYVVYTSGSAGEPKGVMVEHHGIVNLVRWHQKQFRLTSGERSSSVAGLGFDAAAWEMWSSLGSGAALVLLPNSADVDALVRWWEAQAITVSFLPTAIAEYVLARGIRNDHVRIILTGGDVLHCLQEDPRCLLINNYGPTETTVVATSCGLHWHDKILPIGRPIWNTQIYILDGYLQPVPIGVVGEIYIGGAGVARGYLNRADLTAERFIADPFGASGGRLYKSGDLGRYRADGNIEYVGRNDFQVKIRGYRIELGEIESKLSSCEGVREAVVLAREDIPGEKRLVAYVTAQTGEPLVVSALRERLSAELPEYLVPAAYVQLSSLPLTLNGKLDRKALPAPDEEAYSHQRYEAPQGEIEELLAGIWQELLGVERVGRNDNFFELGGHSLLAVRLTSRLRKEFGVEVSLRDLFAQPTLQGVGRLMTSATRSAQTSIELADRSQPLPLSYAQQRLWFLNQLDQAASAAYHIPAALRLEGILDRAALRATLNTIVARHEALRTSFISIDGQPRQQIGPVDIGFQLTEHDLSALGGTDREARVKELSEAEAAGPFDLASGPLIRGQLLQLGAEEHVLLVTMHHIVSDGWSMGVLIREVGALYEALCAGREAALPKLPIQYADYAAGQAQDTTIASSEHHNRYWQEELRHVPVLLNLPTDHPRPARRSFRGASVPFSLGTSLTASLKALAQSCNTTLFVALQTALTVLMARLSGEADLVIGTAVANRHRLEFEALIGLFVNMLPLRMSLRDDPSLAELLRRAREVTLGALTHQEVPFEHIVEMARVPRSLSHSPLFQVVLTLHNTPDNQFRLPDLVIAPMHIPQTAAQWDLSLSVQEAANELTGTFSYAVDLFDEETIKRWARHLQCVLQAMVQDVRQRVSEVSLLSADVRERCLQDIGLDCYISAAEFTLHEMFERQAEKTPNATAVVFEGARLTYKQLNERANRIANYLHSRGVRANQVVAICAEQSIERVAAIIGICKVGAAYLPVDPRYVTQQVARILCEGSPQCILTTDHLAPLFSVYDAVPIESLDVEADVISKQSAANRRDPAVTKRSVAYVIFTSGSTGYPKGVIVEHSNVINLFAAAQDLFHFNEQDVWTQFHSISFDFAVWEMWGALLHGGKLVLVSDATARSPSGFYSLLREERVTVLSQTPTAFAQLCAIATSVPASDDVNSLRWVIFGGESLDIESLAPWIARYGADRPQLVNMFGITETTVHATFHRVLQRDIGRPQRSLIGKSLPGWHVLILDGRSQPVPIGVVGEIYIGGAGVARGYLNRADLTAERFIADPFGASGGRLYKSGDLGRYRADGNIEYVGRNDFQVKIRGYRIELGEIESKLSSCEGVREAVVLAREDIPGEKRLVAYVTAQTGEPLVVSALRERLSAELPEYLVPAAYVQLSSLPLTLNGKLDRKALPAPDEEAYSHQRYEAPQGEIEELLAGIWQELLGVERVGRNDNFFELGGHSLMIVSLIERLRTQGFHLDIRALFTKSSLRELGPVVSIDSDSLAPPPNRIPVQCKYITPAMLPLVTLGQAEIDRIIEEVPGGAANVQDIYPLAPLQEGILFHHLINKEGDAYLLQWLLAFDSRPRMDQFIGALESVISRHDILRTAVVWDGLSEPVQVVWRNAPLRPEIITLQDGDAETQLRKRFDPRHYRLQTHLAPLIRGFAVEDKPANRWLLVVLCHHLTHDHTTADIILKEVRAHIIGQQHLLLPPLPFRNFVAHVRRGVSREEHEVFFRAMLGDIDEPTAPFGMLDVQGDGSDIAEAAIVLEGALAQRLRSSARIARVSTASLCHLAWAQVLARLARRREVVFGTVLFGRMQSGQGADRVLGMFINTLPIRLSIDRQGIQESVQVTHKRLSDLLRHEHASLVLAQRCSSVAAPTPLFSAILNYRHSKPESVDENSSLGWEGITTLHREERTNYPITLSVDDLGEGFKLTAQVNASFDPQRLCNFMCIALEGLLQALERTPRMPINAIEVCPESERRLMLVEWNATQVGYPGGKLVHELFEKQVERTPDAVAVVFEGEQLSYAQLNVRANQLAQHLRERGIGSDQLVGIYLERGIEMMVALLGVLKAGGAYVPLDPQYPAERLRYVLEDALPPIVLTKEHLCDEFPVVSTQMILLDSDWADIGKHSGENLGSTVTGIRPGNLAYVIYTSGSTGHPKGVMVEHGGLLNYLRWAMSSYRSEQGEGSVVASSFAFDATVTGLYCPLLSGQKVVLVKEGEELDGVERLLRTEQRWSLVKISPAHLSALGRRWQSTVRCEVEAFVIGGEALAVETAALWRDLAPQTRLINEYGPTETVVGCIAYEIDEGWEERRGVPIGRPIWNTQIYILDGYLQPVPIGVVGEIYIGGAGVARGYLNRADLTAERFIADPFGASGGRLYKSGDLGRYRADGNIEYVGRNDFQVKIRGYRIELGEIEKQLSRHPKISAVTVVANTDNAGEKRLVAYVVVEANVESDSAPLAAELRAHLIESLPEYMVPAAYVQLSSLPLTLNGKLDRQALSIPYEETYSHRRYEAPQGNIEQALAVIWQDVLKVDHVGRRDNFFDLGGHSLSVMSLALRVHEELLVDLPIKMYFECPTISLLAARMDSAAWIGAGTADENMDADREYGSL